MQSAREVWVQCYKFDLPSNMSIYPIFNIKDLITYKGLDFDEEKYQVELNNDISDLQVLERKQP